MLYEFIHRHKEVVNTPVVIIVYISASLSASEFHLLKKYLPDGMNSDSAPYRRQMETCIRSLLIRARDSALVYWKQLLKKKDDSNAETMKEKLQETLGT